MSVKSDKKLMKELQKSNHQNLIAYSFLAPWIIGFIIFSFGPFLYTFYLSFFQVESSGLGYKLTFIGMGNYITAFFTNLYFKGNLLSFFILEVTYVPAIVIVSFIIGILLNRKLKFRSGFRTIFFLPVIVLSSTVMDKLMESDATRLSDFSENLIFQTTMQYSETLSLALLGLFNNFTLVLWFTGIPVILFINGLQKINQQLYEAAKIDGATTWQILWKITVPIIKPTALVVTIFTIVQLGMFSINPLYQQIKTDIYSPASGLGLTSAYTWIYTVVSLSFVGFAFLLLKDKREKGIKLSSIQRRTFEDMKKKRDAGLETEVSVNG